MVSYHNGDLLTSGCAIICHQVNLQGLMGGGLALQIAKKYPKVEEEYAFFVKQFQKHSEITDLLGTCLLLRGYDYTYQMLDCYIANMFSQNADFTTNYDALRVCIRNLKAKIKEFRAYERKPYSVFKVGIPYKYGCGIADGDWATVEGIWKKAFINEQDIELQIWKFGGENDK